ncbi:transposase family protein [Streptomyces parvus]|uniref:helix-turn-helix domain-containing protein n=1 Tax=Streptomyces parvus TaxID=66428 RepID=UPI003815E20C
MYLRHPTTHDVLACWFGVDHSTLTRAVGEVRPLLAERGQHRRARRPICAHSPRSSTISVRTGRPESSTPPTSRHHARPRMTVRPAA